MDFPEWVHPVFLFKNIGTNRIGAMPPSLLSAVGLLRLPLRLGTAEARSVLQNASTAVSARLYIQVRVAHTCMSLDRCDER